MNTVKKTIKRTLKGLVVSAKMDKTVVVRVDHVRAHPKYKKQYTVSKNYKVHDEKGAGKIGDIVEFAECRPLSKTKRWRMV